MNKAYNVVNTLWFTGPFNTIGIVKVDTGYGIKYYMGMGAGNDAEADQQYIAAHGVRVHPELVKSFLTPYEDEKLA